MLNPTDQKQPEYFFGGIVIDYDWPEIGGCMSEEEYKAWKEEQKMLKKGQRSLFAQQKKEREEKERMEALGLKPITEEDLLNDLPF